MATAFTPDTPFVTAHAADRWDERTAPDSVAPETAWAHAQRIDAGGPFRSVDVRLHHGSETLLLREHGAITSVYQLNRLTPKQYHAVKHALPFDIARYDS
ncbi:hypothetical protein [Haloarcula amylovorans]|uniref:hypothetical protein n=1 Tax=Haloarcula amylovorans TaxID=2562280 RepID=UPI0010768ACC|nr:hypothetical protein [Halomicroarcula amylolytica]